MATATATARSFDNSNGKGNGNSNGDDNDNSNGVGEHGVLHAKDLLQDSISDFKQLQSDCLSCWANCRSWLMTMAKTLFNGTKESISKLISDLNSAKLEYDVEVEYYGHDFAQVVMSHSRKL